MVTAKFIADFTAFNAAVKTAQVEIDRLSGRSSNAGLSLQRMVDSLNGRRLIADATVAAEAVDRIGGVSKLTEKELLRLGGTAQEAVAKMKALGVDVPPGIQKIADASAGATKQASILGDTFKQVFAGFTAAALVTKAVSSLTSFASEAVATAGSLVDLSNKTGLSTETIQRMQYVAKQSGSDMQTFGDAVFKLGVNIEEGTSKARHGAETLGLSFKELRTATPDQQFQMVVKALEGMEDQQKRNTAAVELFGKTAKEILPAIVDGYSRVASEATVAGDSQVHAVDRLGDAWDAFKAKTTTAFVQSAGSIVLLAQAMTSLTKEEREFIAHTDKSIKTLDDFSEAVIRATENKKKFGNLGIGSGADIPLPREAPSLTPTLTAELRAAQAEVVKLTAAEREEIIAGDRVGKTATELADRFGVSETAIKLFKQQTDEATAAAKKLASEQESAAKKMAEANREIAAVTDGQFRVFDKLDPLLTAYVQHLLKAGVAQSTIATVFHLTDTEVKALNESIKLASDILKINNEATIATEESLKKLGMAARDADSELIKMAPTLERMFEIENRLAHVEPFKAFVELNSANLPGHVDVGQLNLPKFKELHDVLGELSNDFAQIAQIADGPLAKAFEVFAIATKGIEQIIRSADELSKSFRNVSDSASRTGSRVASQIGSYAGLVGGIFTFVYELGNALDAASVAADNLAAHIRFASEVAKDFADHRTFSDELIQNIEDVAIKLRQSGIIEYFADELPNAVRRGATAIDGLGRRLAESLSLADFVKELGGLDQIIANSQRGRPAVTDPNVAVRREDPAAQLGIVQDRMRDLLRLAQTGGKFATDAIAGLDEALVAMGRSFERNNGAVNQFFLDMVNQARAAGVELVGVRDLLRDLAKTTLDSLGDIVHGAVNEDEIAAIKKRVDDAQKAVDDAQKAVDKATESLSTAQKDAAIAAGKSKHPDKYDTDTTAARHAGDAVADALDAQKKAADELAAALQAQKDAAAYNLAQLKDLGIIAVGSFGAAVAAGLSFYDALKLAHDPLSQLAKDMADLGITTDDTSLKTLLFLDKNIKAVGALSGLASNYKALANLGLLTPETREAIDRTGVRSINDLYNKAIIGGQTGEEAVRSALLGGQEFLHAAEADAKRAGRDLDPEIAAKIQQSKDLGIWVDAMKSDTDRLIDKLDQILGALQGLKPATTGDSGTPWSEHYPGEPTYPPQTLPGASLGARVTEQGLVYAKEGARILRFLPRGSDTVPAMLTPGERVLSVPQNRAYESFLAGEPTAPIRFQPLPSTPSLTLPPQTVTSGPVTVTMQVTLNLSGADAKDADRIVDEIEKRIANKGSLFTVIDTVAQRAVRKMAR